MNKIELSKVIANDIFAEIPIDCDKSEIGDVLDEIKTIIYSHLSKANTINEEELNRLAEELNPNNPHGDTYEVGQYFGFQDGFEAGYHLAKKK